MSKGMKCTKELFGKLIKLVDDYDSLVIGHHEKWSGKQCRVCILRHNDLDGAMSAAIMMKFLIEDCEFEYKKIDSHSIDYTTDLSTIDFSSYSHIFILDFSLNEPQYKAIYESDTLSEHTIITWIDHHTSSNRIIENHRDVIDSRTAYLINVQDDISAAALVYFFTYIEQYEYIEDVFENAISIEKDENGDIYPTRIPVPRIIKETSFYDTFSEEMNLNFFYGMSTHNYNPETYQSYLWLSRMIESDIFLDSIIEKGETIYRYLQNYNKQIVESQLIQFTMKVPFKYQDQLDQMVTTKEPLYYEFSMIAINRNTNSIVFGDLAEKYDGMMIYWQRSNGNWQYSIYTGANNRVINCGYIAEKFGGGGRRECAGFTLDYNLFDQMIPTRIAPPTRDDIQELPIKFIFKTSNIK